MSELSTPRLRGAIAVAVATVGFALALALRKQLDPWQTTSAVAVASIGLSLWALGAGARAWFAVTARGALGALALGVVLVAATHAAFRLIVVMSPDFERTIRGLYASIDVDAGRVTLALATVIIVVAEELVWRGVAIELAGPGRSRPVRGAISVGLYVVPQLAGGVPLLILLATGLGGLLAAQRLITGRLLDPVVTHAVWSISLFVVFPLA